MSWSFLCLVVVSSWWNYNFHNYKWLAETWSLHRLITLKLKLPLSEGIHEMLCRKEGQLPIFTSARLLCSDQTMMSYQWHEDTVCVHSSQRYEIHDLTFCYTPKLVNTINRNFPYFPKKRMEHRMVPFRKPSVEVDSAQADL